MSKDNSPKDPDEMREHYDFSNAVRAKYAEKFRQGSNVVVLDPDVAAAYPDPQSVNRALRDAAGLPQP